MILDNTPYETLHRTMTEERPKVIFALKKLFDRSQRQFQGARTLPVMAWDTYTVPKSKNKYLIWLYAQTHDEKNRAPQFGYALLVNDKNGRLNYYATEKYKLTTPAHPEGEEVLLLSHYTAHFMSRYRERMGIPPSVTPYELAVTFLGRNQKLMTRDSANEINRRNSLSDDYKSFRVKDGICLIKNFKTRAADGSPVSVERYNTFLDETMLKGKQKLFYDTNKVLFRNDAQEIADSRYSLGSRESRPG